MALPCQDSAGRARCSVRIHPTHPTFVPGEFHDLVINLPDDDLGFPMGWGSMTSEDNGAATTPAILVRGRPAARGHIFLDDPSPTPRMRTQHARHDTTTTHYDTTHACGAPHPWTTVYSSNTQYQRPFPGIRAHPRGGMCTRFPPLHLLSQSSPIRYYTGRGYRHNMEQVSHLASAAGSPVLWTVAITYQDDDGSGRISSVHERTFACLRHEGAEKIHNTTPAGSVSASNHRPSLVVSPLLRVAPDRPAQRQSSSPMSQRASLSPARTSPARATPCTPTPARRLGLVRLRRLRPLQSPVCRIADSTLQRDVYVGCLVNCQLAPATQPAMIHEARRAVPGSRLLRIVHKRSDSVGQCAREIIPTLWRLTDSAENRKPTPPAGNQSRVNPTTDPDSQAFPGTAVAPAPAPQLARPGFWDRPPGPKRQDRSNEITSRDVPLWLSTVPSTGQPRMPGH